MVLCAYVSSTLSVCLWGVLTLDDMTRGDVPLIKHVTTVSDYLNDYKSQTDGKTQDDYSRKFSYYLLSTCWKKIVKRITSWQAMGFIHFLTTILPKELERRGQAWGGFPTGIGLGDKTLMDVLHKSHEHHLIPSLILNHIPSSQDHAGSFRATGIQNLIDISVSASKESKPDSESKLAPAPLFSKNTILEFHHLVVGAFGGFAKAFLQIKAEYSKLVRLDCQALEM